ncbi:hypothetical protein P7K49_026447 [Saguinus oedipus]|uniref:Uncharacterized protein n=1 Tax=Saguinus oedipus TaxID=9490 RepID=A0ABQ9UDM4_SAGOE|nr:hypothetical protein P7K49_026447 [Saguinus oedipus]
MGNLLDLKETSNQWLSPWRWRQSQEAPGERKHGDSYPDSLLDGTEDRPLSALLVASGGSSAERWCRALFSRVAQPDRCLPGFSDSFATLHLLARLLSHVPLVRHVLQAAVSASQDAGGSHLFLSIMATLRSLVKPKIIKRRTKHFIRHQSE